MTTTTSTTADTDRLVGPRKALFRIGLVLAALQALPNIANGGLQAFGDTPTVDGETVPAWVGWSLLIAGVVTLVALVPAWRRHSPAIWAVALSRFSEVSGLLVFAGAIPAADGDETFYVMLAVIACVITPLVLLGLRRR